MFLSKLKKISVVAVVLVLGCLALGGTYRLAAGQQGQQPPDKTRPNAAPVAPAAQKDTAVPKARAARTLKTEGLVHCIAVHPDGKTAATVIWKSANAGKGTVVLWSIKTGKVERTIDESDGLILRRVVFSKDGKTMATSGDGLRNNKVEGEVKVWDVRTGQLKQTFTQDIWVHNVALSPDGTKVAAGACDGTLSVWDTGTGMVLKTMDTGKIDMGWVSFAPWDIAFSPDGKLIAVGGGIEKGTKGKVMLWEAETGKLKHTLVDPAMGVIYSLAFSPDGKSIAAGGVDATCRVWDVVTGAIKHLLNGHEIGIRHLAFSVDGKTLATAGVDKKIILWDIANEKARETLQEHADQVYSLAYAPDGSFLVSGSADNTMRFWPISAPK